MEIQGMERMNQQLMDHVGKVIVGKEHTIELVMTAIIASGHVLLEDVPGTGKTMLAKSVASSLDCTFQRIQFTPDLLPSDLTGIHFFNQKEGDFEFRPGPLFANLVLADEINRATPRTQSSLLECMEERQISIDGSTRQLERPFIVIATQNPVDNQGTFPLPEAQMDRFMMKIRMGYPSSEESVEILRRTVASRSVDDLSAVISREELLKAQDTYKTVQINEDLLRYIIQLTEATRQHPELSLGVSPRGAQALLKASQAWAALHGRDFVLPDDIKVLAEPVLAHRLVFRNRIRQQEGLAERIIQELLNQTEVPTENLATSGR
ncbi:MULTISPECIES: MoxR family ATPase [Paenibacillus]|uniref:MoxR-like ATPase n=2 Tax=Paenibacillus TaxID=44249 RepID=A0ABS4RME1_PAEXY|nr:MULTISPECIES: MoxR family ATPase [Paenibacillus]APO44780.1 magnesium chelatase [Paenibacillus xylanexedens]MBP2244068.1 MoxR-like ATPase [Paenibacillus xylanexedens]MBY0118181.1 MoxR family ATPase [Paenibacillus xylanexedens]MCF7755670.1 MoxR family ATPase [Paenibacillus xylanexedens]MCP1425656.1 MoxR-like ATPase [Paenibacillus xylanexedens]